MSKFGWCLDGHHNDCRVSYDRSVVEWKRIRGKTVIKVIPTGEIAYCECKCHRKKRQRGEK